jgi:hypothetical protein
MLAMFYVEGGKPYYPIYVLVVLADLMEFKLGQAILLGALTYILINFHFYEITVFDKGEYEIGFRYVKIGEQELAVFYPTTEEGEQARWLQT